MENKYSERSRSYPGKSCSGFLLEEMNCENCKCYSALAEPREFEEGYTIFGYCFKRNGFRHNGYPVYIPKGACKEHKQIEKRNGKMQQMSFDDFPEVMP